MTYGEMIPNNIFITPDNANAEYGEKLIVEHRTGPHEQVSPRGVLTTLFFKDNEKSITEFNPCERFLHYSKLCECTMTGYLTVSNSKNESRKIKGDFIKIRFQSLQTMRSSIIFICEKYNAYQVHAANKMAGNDLNALWESYKTFQMAKL